MRLVILLVIWLLSTPLYIGSKCCDDLDAKLASNKNKWKKIEENAIDVFSRKVDGLNYKEFKGTTRIRTTIASLVALFDETSDYTSWLHYCKSAILIKEVDKSERYLYLLYNISGIKREMILHTTTFQDLDNKSVIIKLRDVTQNALLEDLAIQPKVDRVKAVRISWKFIPIEKDHVEVTFQIYIDPAIGGLVRFFFTDKPKILVRETLKKVVSTVVKYNNVDPSILKEIPVKKSS